MAPVPSPKLIARNVAAVRRFADASSLTQTTSGNPVSTRLESGIGNCFPGLECDLRNLERRFFPFLEVDIGDSQIALVGVDSDLPATVNRRPVHRLKSELDANRLMRWRVTITQSIR